MRIKANYYQQFDADLTRDVPGESYGGWKSTEVDLPLKRTALVSMHAWHFGGRDEYPGLYRAVEYMPRSEEILRTVYPRILAAARAGGMPVFHVVSGGNYYKGFPGYMDTVRLAGKPPDAPAGAPQDPVVAALNDFKARKAFPGEHNQQDATVAHTIVKFPEEALPVGNEPIAQTAHELNAVCRAASVSHLIYIGFAINWCILMSPGGMMEMSRLGYMCSAVRQATTAVENKETARRELCKQEGLWRVALAFGFVFDADDLIAALCTEAAAQA